MFKAQGDDGSHMCKKANVRVLTETGDVSGGGSG